METWAFKTCLLGQNQPLVDLGVRVNDGAYHIL